MSIFKIRHNTFRFLIQSAGYLLSTALGRIGVVLGVFVYSYFISPDDMGLYNVFNSYIWIVAIIISLNCHTGFGRYLYETDIDSGKLLANTIIFISVISVFLLISLISFSNYIESPFDRGRLVMLFVVIAGIGNVTESILTQISAYSEDSAYLLRVMIIKSVASVAITMALLSLSSMGYMAIIYGDIIGSLFLIFYLIFYQRVRIIWSVRIEYIYILLRYSVPLMPYMLSIAILSQFDRVIIAHFFGEGKAGLYSLAYNFGILPMLAATAVVNASNRRFFENFRNADFDALRTQTDVTFWVAALVSGVMVAFGELLSRWLLPDAYADGFFIVPIVACAGLVFIPFQLWVRALAFRDRPGVISTIAVLGTVVNLALNIGLMSRFGPYFAAWSTFAAYALLSVACIFMAERLAGVPRREAKRALGQLCIVSLPAVILALPLSTFVAQLLQLMWFGLMVVLASRAVASRAGDAVSPENGL